MPHLPHPCDRYLSSKANGLKGNKVSQNYFYFQSALEDSYYCDPERSPFERVWQAEDSENVPLAKLTGRVWKNNDGLFAPGYLHEAANGFGNDSKNVIFMKLPCTTLNEAIDLSIRLTKDVCTIHEGYLHKLAGAKGIL